METLFAIAVTVATLKAHDLPPAPPQAVALVQRREAKADKPRLRSSKPEPSIGF